MSLKHALLESAGGQNKIFVDERTALQPAGPQAERTVGFQRNVLSSGLSTFHTFSATISWPAAVG